MNKLLFLIAPLIFLHHSVVAIENDVNDVANLTVNNKNGTDAASLVGDQKKDEDLRKKKGEDSEELKAKEENKKKKGSLDEKKVPVGETRVVECDPSNKCIVDKSKLVACLRVSGKDSLDLSLLIQNKGTEPLAVTIHAPDPEFVRLEFGTVQVKAKEDKEVTYLGMVEYVFFALRNFETLLKDEFYIGLKQKRAAGQEYSKLLHEFMSVVKQNYGEKVLIQFEDFANHHAFELLAKYSTSHLIFNDDIQTKAPLDECRKKIWLVDSRGFDCRLSQGVVATR